MDEALEVAGWRLAIDDLPSEALPDMAASALARGLDTPSLCELAGLPRGKVRHAVDLFRSALVELGIDGSSEDAALGNLVRWPVAEIVVGRIAPHEGASWVWRKASDRVQEEGDLRIFVGLASEWDDHEGLSPWEWCSSGS